MTIVLIAALAALLLWALWRTVHRMRHGSACCGEREADERRLRQPRRKRAELPFSATADIGGMTCDNCARRVENALNALPGVRARVDISRHKAMIRSEAPLDETQVRQAVSSAGYVLMGLRR